jgi:hypothetical protein
MEQADEEVSWLVEVQGRWFLTVYIYRIQALRQTQHAMIQQVHRSSKCARCQHIARGTKNSAGVPTEKKCIKRRCNAVHIKPRKLQCYVHIQCHVY